MKIASIAIRIVLGLLFVGAGAGAFAFTNPPPLPGLAGDFNAAFVHSHWSLFVGAAQLAIGVLLLANRYVTAALTMLAAFLYNSFAFHATMMPAGLPMVVAVAAMWFFLCWDSRRRFAALFAAR
jgi:putative oxidoreductase